VFGLRPLHVFTPAHLGQGSLLRNALLPAPNVVNLERYYVQYFFKFFKKLKMERHEAWIDRAKSSLEIAGTRNSNLVYYEDLCYQAQQAVEKAVKGLLIYYREPLKTGCFQRFPCGFSPYGLRNTHF
jgi:hypothetical protein